MYKIRNIKFHDHPVLGNLSMDFCGKNGKVANTVIIAGENGTGKSTLLNELFKISSHSVTSPIDVEFEDDENIFSISYYLKNHSDGTSLIYANDRQGLDSYIDSNKIKHKYPFNGIFSDVDINFHANEVSTVTSLTLDSESKSRRSTNNLPTQIKQLLIDIQSLDDAELARAARNAPETPVKDLQITERMPRFTNAFNKMFDDLVYDRIENSGTHKSIIFRKNNIKIPIDALSSGEKQIVYRGCFLLKDINATNGAFVFIDEPEISLHPNWQKKIMDYYKGIFTNENGQQTSQIFTVTHSPFIIHNDNRKNDKIIVLSRDDNGNIIVKDKPEYYKCNSAEVVQDAFFIKDFSQNQSTVYLEGRTDEMYFNKALEVYQLSVPFQFKWVGYIDEKGQESNTGKDALNKAASFLISSRLPIKNVCLYDCDTNKPTREINNVVTMCIQKKNNDKGIRVGIENALIFGDFDVEPYRKQTTTQDDYGCEKRIPHFEKMDCCRDICALDSKQLLGIFANLKSTIDELVKLFQKE